VRLVGLGGKRHVSHRIARRATNQRETSMRALPDRRYCLKDRGMPMPRSLRLLVLCAATALTADFAWGQTPTSPSRTTAEEVIVTAAKAKAVGGGLIKTQTDTKSVSTVSSAYIQTQASIQNAYQYIQLAPGTLVSTTDPFGLSEQFSINVRGLGQDELGYVLEGMPLNDIGYYTAYPSQFIDSENIDEISLAQGSADLDSPVISAAGGLMNITMLDPSLHTGGSVDVSYGSYNTGREFIRLDSGLIGSTGMRAFISYSHTDSDLWRGPGAVKRQHIDWKVVKEWGDGNRVAWSGEYHDGITPTYTLPTLQEYRQLGTTYNYGARFLPGNSTYWRILEGTFRIVYTAIPTRLTLTDNLTLNVTPYWQYGYGNSPYPSYPLTETGNYQGVDGPYTVHIPNYAATGGVVQANYQDLQYRTGLVAKLTYTLGDNSFIVGAWTDYADEKDTESYSAFGEPADIWADTHAGLLRLPNGQIFLGGGDHVITKTNELFVADTLRVLDDKLTAEIGFKEAMVSRDGTNAVPGPQYAANINNAEPLPRFALRYRPNAQDMFFVSATTNFRTPSEATFFDQYYGGEITAAANTNLKPEYSISEEIGYRYTGSLVTASATLFNYNFTDRQIATLNSELVNVSTNVGGQTTRGIDAEAGTRAWHHISTYASFEYLHATIDNDISVQGDYAPTRGKTAIRSPRVQAGLGLSYDDSTFFGNLGLKFVDKQYATFMDDESIPSYVTMDLALGYRFPSVGLKARPELKLNLLNLNEGSYLSGVANPTTNVNTVIGRHGTMIAGSAPTYYLSAGLSALVTLRQAF
jgi:iron complex outermembrane receptor protein